LAARQYEVLVNEEQQYGLFPAELPPPAGWVRAGFSGSEEECVAYVDTHWTDMRPRSLRERLDVEAAAGRRR
jgi:MbtH protein